LIDAVPVLNAAEEDLLAAWVHGKTRRVADDVFGTRSRFAPGGFVDWKDSVGHLMLG
jgi:hypothetical protein